MVNEQRLKIHFALEWYRIERKFFKKFKMLPFKQIYNIFGPTPISFSQSPSSYTFL